MKTWNHKSTFVTFFVCSSKWFRAHSDSFYSTCHNSTFVFHWKMVTSGTTWWKTQLFLLDGGGGNSILNNTYMYVSRWCVSYPVGLCTHCPQWVWPGQVSDLTHQAITNQNVSRAQISVNVVHPLDVCHASSHLNTQTLTLKSAEQSQILKE